MKIKQSTGQRGGKRRGAGRPKGAASKANEEARREASTTGETPQQYMLRVMRDETAETERRDRMAIAAAPYQHARLAAVEHMGKGGGPIEYSDVRDRLAHLIDREATEGDPAEDNPTTH